VQILLDGGADPEVRARIDACETPLEMAEAAGLEVIAAILARKGAPLRQRLRSGLIRSDTPPAFAGDASPLHSTAPKKRAAGPLPLTAPLLP
jgi:hypothetical protein